MKQVTDTLEILEYQCMVNGGLTKGYIGVTSCDIRTGRNKLNGM